MHPGLDVDSSYYGDDDTLHSDRSSVHEAGDYSVAYSKTVVQPSYNNNTKKDPGNVTFASTTSLEPRPATSATSGDVVLTTRSSFSSPHVTFPRMKEGLMFPRSLIDGVDKFQEEKRRLLPKCPNGLHIIEGPDYRYFVGIVDFLTRFDWRQKMAQHWKMVKYKCGDHSTKHPDIYSRRFVNFLTEKVR